MSAPRIKSAPTPPRPGRSPSSPEVIAPQEDLVSRTRLSGTMARAETADAFDETIPADVENGALPPLRFEPPRAEPSEPQSEPPPPSESPPGAVASDEDLAEPPPLPPRAPRPEAKAAPRLDPRREPEEDEPAKADELGPEEHEVLLTDATIPEPAAMETYRPGDVIAGKYKLNCVIGRGGMGAVWLAHNLTLDIDVAIKLIRRDRAAPDAPGRLLQEARAAARLGHPSIVRVFDFGESEQGDPFIVMEVIHGESLSAVLARRGRLPAYVAVQTILPIASALVEAHGKGIVHRDLKPDNILIVEEESGALIPKVVDFGIAKLLDAEADRRFTLAGEVLGSPDYMSPEQARGEADVGECTDVWALSVVLYELMTGRRPFQGANYNALIISIITSTVRPTVDLAAGDEGLWEIVHRGLAKDIRERWPNVREMGAALAMWLIDQGIEQDVAGTALASHWVSTGARRALSIHPPAATEASMARSAPKGIAPDVLAIPPPPALPVIDGALDADDAPINSPFRPSRAPWVVLGLVVALGALGYALWTNEAANRAAQPGAAPTVAQVTEAAPATEPKPAPEPTAEPSASALAGPKAGPGPKPVETAVTKPVAPVVPKKPRPPAPQPAPPVPEGIRF